MRKYFIYCRKSSEEQTKQVQSLSTQKRLLADVVKHNSLHVVDSFFESKSAKDPNNRPVFLKMIERIRTGDANSILVLHTDRLSRNLAEAGVLINLFDTGILKEIRTPTNIYQASRDFFYAGFDFLVATQYSRDLSIKVKEGVESKLKKGIYPAYAPIGYLNRDGGIVPDPNTVHHIQTLYTLAGTGEYSLKDMTETLFNAGFRSRSNKKVYKSKIQSILNNPIYYGTIRYAGKEYPGIHEPIISKAQFDRAKTALENRLRPKKQKHDFLYRSYLT